MVKFEHLLFIVLRTIARSKLSSRVSSFAHANVVACPAYETLPNQRSQRIVAL